MEQNAERKREYISVAEIQQEYLPISKKKIRAFCKAYLNCKVLGKRMLVNRKALEDLLASNEKTEFPL